MAPTAVMDTSPVRRVRSGLEVHTLLGHDGVPLYAHAISSLHRHVPDARAIVHDDGTLDRRDRSRLRRNINAVAVIRKQVADAQVERRLACYPNLLTARRGNVRLCQLVDYCLLASRDRIVGMDSDVVHLRRPDSVLEWVGSNATTASVLYSPERDPKGPHWVPAIMPGAPYVAEMCCGFVCLAVSRFFSAAYLEGLLVRTPATILLRRRFVTQMLYSLMAARPGQDAVSLGARYESGRLRWLPARDDRVICHYFASHGRRRASQSLVEERKLFAQAGLRVPRFPVRARLRGASGLLRGQ